jgi:4-hydroxy-4-methyl-2-oxoglutarate aldolase
VPELDELARRFSAVYTGVIADALDRLGYLNQTLPPEVTPLAPGTRLAGPAFTIEGRPQTGKPYDTVIRGILAMLGSVPAGHVAVYQANERTAAHLGELSTASLQARGCAGAVLDGGCRDVGFILEQRFPVFCRYTTARDSVFRWEVAATGVPVTIGDVRVHPDDYVVADRDGIVVVPLEVRDAVLADAEAKAATENEIRVAIADGATPLEAYERYGTF